MKRSVIAGICLLMSAGGAWAVERFTLNSVRQVDDRPPTVRVYLDAPEAAGLGPDQVTATLGQDSAQVASVETFEASGEGVATIFLVDISRSLTTAQFSAIQDAIDSWIDQFSPADRGAILAFGNESRLVVDFTADPATLRAGLASLGPTANRTLFHQALADALDLSRRQDPSLPGRRVIAVLTDGLDEGSGLALDDVLDRLRDDPVPIHAIGYSRLQPAERRQQYLEVLRRLSTNSGGSFFEARRSNFAESYAAIREAVRRVWVVDVVCQGCRADGNRHRLQLNLSVGGRVLSQGTDVRLLPDPTKGPLDRIPAGSDPTSSTDRTGSRTGSQDSETSLEDGSRSDGSQGDGSAGETSEDGGSEDGGPVSSWMFGLLAGLAVLLLLLIFGARGRKGDSTEEGSEVESDGEEPKDGRDAAPPIVPILPTEPETPPPSRPRPVRLIVVRGSRKGKEYLLTLRETAVLGSRSDCDCVLTEPAMGAQQFELSQDDGRVFLRNLATSNVTRMGGHAVTEATRVRSGDLVGTSEVILRIVLDP